ncbi:MAG: HYR domain-containing protein, partial [Methylococcales bacterium]|nr:HYR domain-containing protein [Methylococcales bacterium]
LTETSTSSPGGSWNGTGSGPAAHADIDVSAHANANFQARFIFDDGSGWVWWVAIDNYMLTTGTPSVANDFNGTDNASGSYPVGTTTVTWTVTDASGNTANCTTDVTVNDVELPVITCPADIAVGNDAGVCGAVVTWNAATVTDNCPGASVTGSTHASGDNFAVGTTTVTITATDASGNTATCDFDVTVNDTENPVVTCPADMTVGNDAGVCEAVVTYTMPTATDNCDGTLTPSLTAGMASGATFPVGTTTVTYSATDAAGNTGDCSFDVTVEDREAPVITCPADQTVSNDPGLCSATFSYTITATDNCSQNVPVFTFGQNVGPVFPTGVVTIMGV